MFKQARNLQALNTHEILVRVYTALHVNVTHVTDKGFSFTIPDDAINMTGYLSTSVSMNIIVRSSLYLMNCVCFLSCMQFLLNNDHTLVYMSHGRCTRGPTWCSIPASCTCPPAPPSAQTPTSRAGPRPNRAPAALRPLTSRSPP